MELEQPKPQMDMKIALSHVGGDKRFLAELADLFLQDYPRLLDELRQSVLDGDHASLERAAHTLKGRFAFFGFHAMRDKLLKLELMGREGKSSGCRELLSEVESAIEHVLPEFRALVRDQGE